MSKTVIPLDLDSLVPTEVTFRVSGWKEEITLKKWSLKIKQQAIKTIGAKRLGEIFKSQEVVGMAEIVYKFLMKAETRDKFEAEVEKLKGDRDLEVENGFDVFLLAISSPKDQTTVVKALVATVGIGEPELKVIEKALKHPVNANSEHALDLDEMNEKAGENADPNVQSPNP